MADSYFVLLEQSATTGRYRAESTTIGPWDERLQHGGPPNALAVRAAERAVAAETGRDDLVALRIASEFVGPVPVAEVSTAARIVRAARSAVLAEVELSAGGRTCLTSRVWFVRSADTATHATALAEPGPVSGDEDAFDTSFGYGASLETRFVRGRMGERGPAAAWMRPRPSLVDGEGYSGLARVATVADSGNGISAELDWARWSFVNIDLDIHLARPFEGEWVLLGASTQLGPTGSGLAQATISDVRGLAGTGLQTLVVSPIPTR